MGYIQEHWAIIATILFGVSELLAEVPQIKSNSVFQLLTGWLRTQKKD